MSQPQPSKSLEGVYSVTKIVTKKGKGMLSSTEKDKVVSRDENHSSVLILRDEQGSREYIEVPLPDYNLPSYNIRGEFNRMSEGNILIYKYYESRGRTSSYTFTYDSEKNILEGIRKENEGAFEYTYRLTYLRLMPKAAQ